ncbi:uncharacterized protein LOC120710470 [Panicum virgatum]|uniref:uncharacterized protein LOC120710470 n=1 Tax=Panicum virgatum TaxID=38727 RepID=UPI0019D67DD8|nr:uncharacterized protein LOC120710470 [Panicum virgatum]
MAPSSTRTAAAEALVRTVRLFVDGPGKRVLFAEASEGAAAFLFALLAAVGGLLRKDPASAAAGCFGNLAAAEALLPGGPASTASSRAPPPASPAPKGMGIMGRRLFRCGHLGCRCSDVASREAGSACPCASPSCSRASANGDGASGRRDTELHFLEACLYRRPDGSAAAALGRGAGRSGNAFYRCRARDERHGREIVECRFRVTDERGVECPLCGSHTTAAVTCAKGRRRRGLIRLRASGRGGRRRGRGTSYHH